MEQLELTDPVVTPPKATYKVTILTLDYESMLPPATDPGSVYVQLKDNLGGMFYHHYTGKEATDMIRWINTANFSVNSLHKKLLQKLSTDGVLPGTVTGTPDPPPVAFDIE